jgi:hypothetical protein
MCSGMAFGLNASSNLRSASIYEDLNTVHKASPLSHN